MEVFPKHIYCIGGVAKEDKGWTGPRLLRVQKEAYDTSSIWKILFTQHFTLYM